MFKHINYKVLSFWIISFSILTILTLPVLIQDGMFMDAVQYTAISRNMSIGFGNFWYPQLSYLNVAELPAFHEQPPLGFGIMAIFFKIFGDNPYVERFFVFLTLIISALLIAFLWKNIFRNDDSVKKLAWFPIVLWIIIPVCFWSFRNNVLENTMNIFTLLAVLFIYRYLSLENHNVFNMITGSVFIFCAAMTKGLPGLFPLALPFLYFVSTKRIKFRRMFLSSLIILTTLIVLFLLMFIIFPESKDSLSVYFLKRVLYRIDNDPTVQSRFYILGRLFLELLPLIIISTLTYLISRKKSFITPDKEKKSEILLWTFVGLSGSLPMMLTPVQKGFYLVPALAYFAIAAAIFNAGPIENFFGKIHQKYHKKIFILSLILFISVYIFSFLQIGKTSRDKEILEDIYIIGEQIPRQSIVTTTPELWQNWNVQCYFMRYFIISLDPGTEYDYFVAPKNEKINPKYTKINLTTSKFDLYRKKLN